MAGTGTALSPLVPLGLYTGDRQIYLAQKISFAQPGKERTCRNLRIYGLVQCLEESRYSVKTIEGDKKGREEGKGGC